jgi:hypothetical protein
VELPGSTNGTSFEDSWTTAGSEVRTTGSVVITVAASELEVGVPEVLNEA